MYFFNITMILHFFISHHLRMKTTKIRGKSMGKSNFTLYRLIIHKINVRNSSILFDKSIFVLH